MRRNGKWINLASSLLLTCFGSTAVTAEPLGGCPLCTGMPPAPVVVLSLSKLDSNAHALAEFNEIQIARVDSLYRLGRFGEPGSESARGIAHLCVRLKTMNAYPDFIRMASDTTCIYEGTGEVYRELNRRYSDAVVFCAVQATRVRMGLGRVCIRYDVTGNRAGEEAHGGRRLRWRTQQRDIDGQERRLVSVDLPTSTDKVVEALFASHYSCRVGYSRETGPPAPYDWYVVYDIEGGWIRKFGTHRPTAYMFWVTPLWTFSSSPGENHNAPGAGWFEAAAVHTAIARMPGEITETPQVGVRIYVPRLRLRLPSLLPDIPFDDLREVELPMPILEIDYLRGGRWPSWLGTGDNLTFGHWRGYGDVPAAVRERFPDR